jgi:hypothetical protein
MGSGFMTLPSGDFFLGSVVGTTLTKLCLRYMQVAPAAGVEAKEVNRTHAEIMLYIVCILRLGKHGGLPTPIDDDSTDRLMLCLKTLTKPEEYDREVWLSSCRKVGPKQMYTASSYTRVQMPPYLSLMNLFFPLLFVLLILLMLHRFLLLPSASSSSSCHIASYDVASNICQALKPGVRRSHRRQGSAAGGGGYGQGRAAGEPSGRSHRLLSPQEPQGPLAGRAHYMTDAYFGSFPPRQYGHFGHFTPSVRLFGSSHPFSTHIWVI